MGAQKGVGGVTQVGVQPCPLLLLSLAGLGHPLQLQQKTVQPRMGTGMSPSGLCPRAGGGQEWEHLGG